MEAKSGLRTEFDMEGIVLVDEIETHLHLELQDFHLHKFSLKYPQMYETICLSFHIFHNPS